MSKKKKIKENVEYKVFLAFVDVYKYLIPSSSVPGPGKSKGKILFNPRNESDQIVECQQQKHYQWKTLFNCFLSLTHLGLKHTHTHTPVDTANNTVLFDCFLKPKNTEDDVDDEPYNKRKFCLCNWIEEVEENVTNNEIYGQLYGLLAKDWPFR